MGPTEGPSAETSLRAAAQATPSPGAGWDVGTQGLLVDLEEQFVHFCRGSSWDCAGAVLHLDSRPAEHCPLTPGHGPFPFSRSLTSLYIALSFSEFVSYFLFKSIPK